MDICCIIVETVCPAAIFAKRKATVTTRNTAGSKIVFTLVRINDGELARDTLGAGGITLFMANCLVTSEFKDIVLIVCDGGFRQVAAITALITHAAARIYGVHIPVGKGGISRTYGDITNLSADKLILNVKTTAHIILFLTKYQDPAFTQGMRLHCTCSDSLIVK